MYVLPYKYRKILKMLLNLLEVIYACIMGRRWYIPMLNADGYEKNRRNNMRGYDLNRVFPVPAGPNGAVSGGVSQPETDAYIAFSNAHTFVAAAMYAHTFVAAAMYAAFVFGPLIFPISCLLATFPFT